MPFNTKIFRDRIKSVAKPNLFDLQIMSPPTSIFVPEDLKLFDEIPFRAYSTQLPSVTLDSIERRYHGPLRNIPVGYYFQQINVSIMETPDYAMRRIFDRWTLAIAPDTNGYYGFYYDELIAKEMHLNVYDRTSDRVIRQYILEEVYPISISPIVLDWGYKDTFTAVNVDFIYRKWSVR